MAQHDAVEPSGSSPTAGHRAELPADIHELITKFVGELRRERTGADPSRIRLRNADHSIDVPRSETGACAGSTSGRIRRGDVGVGPVVEVQERGLRPLKENVRSRVKRVVQQVDRVGEVGDESLGQRAERLHHLIDVEGVAASGVDDLVLSKAARADRRRECLGIGDFARPHTDPLRLVGVRRTDALQGGADLVVTAHRFRDRVMALMPREDEVGAGGHPEPRAVDSATLQHVDLVEKGREVDDNAVGDNRGDRVVENTARHQLQRVALLTDDDSVTGVVAALVSDDHRVFLGQ